MKTPVNNLEGEQLNVAFASALELDSVWNHMKGICLKGPDGEERLFKPSTNYTHLWRYIVERRIELTPLDREDRTWQAQCWKPYGVGHGKTPELAACRAVVNSVYGDEWETRIFPQ